MVFCVEGFSIGTGGTEFVAIRSAVIVSCPLCLCESNMKELVHYDEKNSVVNIYLNVHCYSSLSFESELLYQECYSMKKILLRLVMN
jgi:hypothetical protein